MLTSGIIITVRYNQHNLAVMIALLKSSGLVDRMTVTLHPLMRPFGLAGRDLVHVMMGFGCNVPAVVNTRACSSSSRANCITAIGIRAPCSYQLPATVSVLTVAGMAYLVAPYLLFLAVVKLALLAIFASSTSRDPQNHLLIEGRAFLQWPQWSAIRRETAHVVNQFFTVALPVFFIICVLAAVLAKSGVPDACSRLLGPLMSLFNLPPEAALALVLGSIREDGLAIGLLDQVFFYRAW
jgi:Fe2+ transport system protein B